MNYNGILSHHDNRVANASKYVQPREGLNLSFFFWLGVSDP